MSTSSVFVWLLLGVCVCVWVDPTAERSGLTERSVLVKDLRVLHMKQLENKLSAENSGHPIGSETMGGPDKTLTALVTTS